MATTTMEHPFLVHATTLKDGGVIEINASRPADYLGVADSELTYTGDVTVVGEAYLAGDEFILRIKASVTALIPCVICNKPVAVEVEKDDIDFTTSLGKIYHGQFDFSELVREYLILETPAFAECNNGNCPERKSAATYLSTGSDPLGRPTPSEEGYHPFANLDDSTNK